MPLELAGAVYVLTFNNLLATLIYEKLRKLATGLPAILIKKKRFILSRSYCLLQLLKLHYDPLSINPSCALQVPGLATLLIDIQACHHWQHFPEMLAIAG